MPSDLPPESIFMIVEYVRVKYWAVELFSNKV